MITPEQAEEEIAYHTANTDCALGPHQLRMFKSDIGDRMGKHLSFYEWGGRVHYNAIVHGFWRKSEDVPTKLMLMVDELSELHEHIRNGEHPAKWWTDPDKSDKPDGPAIELADLYIRGLDYAAHFGVNLLEAMGNKHRYNIHRPYLHNRTH